MTETPSFVTIRRFLPYLWPPGRTDLRVRVAAAFVLVIAAKAMTLAMPFAYKGAIDALSTDVGRDIALAAALVLAYAGARFGGVLFDNLRNAIFERVGQTAAQALALDVFGHLHRLSLRFHLERRTGSLTRVVERGVKSVDTMLYFLLFNIGPTIFELVAVCVIFWLKLGWPLVVATLAMVALYIVFTRVVTDWRNRVRREMVDHDNHATARAVDSLLNYETVKYFGAERVEHAGYRAATQRYRDSAVKNESSLAALNVGQSLITNVMMAGAMAWTVYGYARGDLTVGDVVLVNTLLAQLFRPLDMLGMVYREVKQGLIDMEQMFGLLDTNAEIKDAPNAKPLAVSGAHVRFEHVDFAYEPRRPILHDVGFEVRPGAKVAIVGHSGAGKSTVSRILYRFYEISGGRVTIDGQDIRDVTQESLRRAIGIVPQDTVLFNDTIGYNIGYGAAGRGPASTAGGPQDSSDGTASQTEIEQAARQAQIHDFIVGLPDGYDTMVGERGLKLSGGEKQRVAIARTILKDPALLILDEATSALDSKTEADIQSALRAVSAERTTIVVAHRLSTIVDSDEILVMDAGRIIERGRHVDLVARGGVYADMWARQQAEEEEAALAAAE